jgi:hypothetical protein
MARLLFLANTVVFAHLLVEKPFFIKRKENRIQSQ